MMELLMAGVALAAVGASLGLVAWCIWWAFTGLIEAINTAITIFSEPDEEENN